MSSARRAGIVVLGLALMGEAHPSSGQGGDALTRALEATQNLSLPSEDTAAKAVLERRATKIDPALLQLNDEVDSKGFAEFTAKAASLGVPVSERRVLVTLLAEDEDDAQRLRREAERRGAEVQSIFENAVYVELPPAEIEAMDEIDELEFAMPQGVLEPARRLPQRSATVTSEGVAASKVDHLHKSNIVGRGVRIGILDFGFQGLSRLVTSGEVPQPKGVKAFGSPTVENGEVHGAACAEIIHDMAPGAELYLASVGDGDGGATDGQIVAAAQWLAAQKPHIISFSGGGHVGPKNGRSGLDRLVEAIARDHNVLWVNAAGNEGDQHFGGLVSDVNRDGVAEFSTGQTGIAFQPTNGWVAVDIMWDDWGDNPAVPSSSQNIDAFLYAVDAGGKAELVAKSENPQHGPSRPTEFIRHRAPNPSQLFVLKLRATRLTRPVRLHVFEISGARMEPKNPEGSIGYPATSPSALAVGAVDVTTTMLEAFSSQGPTDDERSKPDVSAPDKTVSVSYRTSDDPDGRFPGTSAACPHVAGFAALLKQLNPSATPDDLRKLIIKNVRDMGPAGFDLGYGHGHIDGTNVPTSMSVPTTVDAPAGGYPEVFGNRLSDDEFERLWSLGRRQPDEGLRVVTGSAAYRVGDGLKVGMRSDRSCHFLLAHRSSEGEYTVLASSEERGRMAAGERYALPEGETWKIQPPTGEDGLLLICSGEPVDLADWLRRPDDRVRLATTTFEVRR